jgi:CubicO group peptidase (beta-lactamase class C family)
MAKKSELPLPFAEPEEVGLSSERLSLIRPAMQRFIDKGMEPNFVTMVIRQGKIVHYEALGYMDIDSKEPVRKDTIYRLWSNTKPITGVAAMICVEEGLLSLDDPVSKYIPAYKNQRVRVPAGQGPMMGTPTVPVERDITVRDCLRNTTGLPTARRVPLAYMNEFGDLLTKSGLLLPVDNLTSIPIREMVDALGQLPLEAQPGTEFEYQVGFPLAGIVIETVTGKNLEEFYQEYIFKPLGMNDTSFYLDKSKLERFPSLYQPVYKSGKWELRISEKPEESEKVTGPKTYFGPGGGAHGVLSPVTDYARFGQMLLNGGELDGVRILSRKSVEIMTSSHTGDMDLGLGQPGMGFGIGIGVYMGGGSPRYRSVGTFGWGGAAGTTFFVDPKEDLIGICFTQVFGAQAIVGNTYQEDFERLVYQSLI